MTKFGRFLLLQLLDEIIFLLKIGFIIYIETERQRDRSKIKQQTEKKKIQQKLSV